MPRVVGAFMREHRSALVIGVVGSVVAAVLLALWGRVIVPWYEGRTDQGATIEGTWVSEITFPEGERNKHRMLLRKAGYNISGETTCYEGYSKGNSYAIQGTFKNLILTATYEIENQRRLERGSMVLMLGNDGKTLSGYLSYYDDLANSIRTTKCDWIREDGNSSN
jgi:hypothetical protein